MDLAHIRHVAQLGAGKIQIQILTNRFLECRQNFCQFLVICFLRNEKKEKISRFYGPSKKKGAAGPMYFAIYKIIEKRQTKWTKMHKKQYKGTCITIFYAYLESYS